MLKPEHLNSDDPLSSQKINTAIVAILPKLQEGDRLRLLKFAEAMVQQRKGKRAQRAKRFEQR